jgi:alpha-beta hydrolase superfamily lysophospholipase
MRGPPTQLGRVVAKVQPFFVIPTSPDIYGQTLHVSGTGEWEFDTELKPFGGFPVTFGWLNAIRRAHAQVHRGIETGVPALVLRSDRSDLSGKYAPDSDRSDLVLLTDQIGQWAASLGAAVTETPVEGARYDVFLSFPDARARAYTALDDWLTQILPG